MRKSILKMPKTGKRKSKYIEYRSSEEESSDQSIYTSDDYTEAEMMTPRSGNGRKKKNLWKKRKSIDPQTIEKIKTKF